MNEKLTNLWNKAKTIGAKVWPKAKKVISKWYDVLILLPVSLLFFIFNESWVRSIDQTAASMSLEFLVILNLNILLAVVANSFAYIIYNLYFHDYFDKDWEKKKLPDHPVAAAVIQLVLWVFTFGVNAFIILHGLI